MTFSKAESDFEQIVRLEDEADVAADRHQFGARQADEIVVEHADVAVLHRAQRADQTEQRRLAGPRGPRHDDKLARRDIEPIVEQNLVAGRALAEMMIEVRDLDEGWPEIAAVEHQKTSAGSATMTRRIAINPAATHMPTVSARVVKVSESVICIGPTAMPPMT